MDKLILEKLINEKQSIRSISKSLDKSPSTIRYWLDKYGLKTDTGNYNRKEPYIKNVKTFICIQCGKTCEQSPNTYNKYCSNRCQADFTYKFNVEKWRRGEDVGYCGEWIQLKPWIRRYLLEKYNNACVKCGWDKVHPKDGLPLVEVNHIDGDAKNCREDNLELLCRNCHSMTDNFGSRNRGFGTRPKKDLKIVG